MLNCLSKTTDMSLTDFLKLERKQITLDEIIKNNTFENFTTKILESHKTKRFVISFLASLLYAKKVLAVTNGNSIDVLGFKFLGLIRHWAYWILLIMCIVEVVRAGISNDSKKILSIVMKFILMFASLYLVPELFDAIKSAFMGG